MFRTLESLESRRMFAVALDAAGWTQVTPSADTRIVYVSSSVGKDTNTGLSPDSPVATISKGKSLVRNNSADWMLLKRGDAFYGTFGQWTASGRSAQEPVLISAYGEGDRPVIKSGSQRAFYTQGGSNSPKTVGNFAIIGLSFYAHTRDPNSPEFTGTSGSPGAAFFRAGSNILVEDTKFAYYADNVVVQGLDGDGINNFTLRRSIIVDSYGSGKAQGIYSENTHGLTIEENVFDHNGWNESPKVPTAYRNQFSHNIYLNQTVEGVVLRNNLITGGSSHGAQVRPGGIVEGNVFARNGLGFYVSRTASQVRDNVVLEGQDISADIPRSWGMQVLSVPSATVERNIIAHDRGARRNGPAIQISPDAGNVQLTSNIVYDWPSGLDDQGTGTVLSGNKFGDRYEYVDPNRTLGTYNATLGGEASYEAFMANARAQSKSNWRPAYTASAARQYIAAGFTPAAPTKAPDQPTGLKAEAGSQTAVKLAWTDTSVNESGFRIERTAATGTPAWKVAGRVGADVTTFTDTGLTAATAYLYRVVAENVIGSSAASATAAATTYMGNTASFVMSNSALGGTWIGAYGREGYEIANATTSLYPSYAKRAYFSGASKYTWAASTKDVRGLQKPGDASARTAATWYANEGTLGLDLSADGRAHRVSIYMVDWDGGARKQRVDVIDTDTGVTLDSRTVSDFRGGRYLSWNLSGRVQIKITRLSGANAVVSGLFFDPAAPPMPGVTDGSKTAASYLGEDTSAGVGPAAGIGLDGSVVAGATSASPGYVKVSTSGGTAFKWSTTTTDARAVQTTGSSRLASAWYSGTTMDFNLKFTDGKNHRLGMYLLDWDSNARAQTIEVFNADTGALLDSRSAEKFNGGKYLFWNVSGNIRVRVTRTGGQNAVVSGLFFDTPAPAGAA